MIYIYRVLHIILLPLFIIYFGFRILSSKEDFKRIKERFGTPSLDRDSSEKLIWVHSASVGESLAVLPIVKRLALTKNTKVLVTTGSVTSAKLMTEKLPKNAFHQFVPVDYSFAVKKFMKHWNPDVSIFVESDLWPNLVNLAPNKILINARMSDRSFNRYLKMKPVAGLLLNDFDCIYTQSQQDFDRFKSLSSANVINAGNIKYDGAAPDYKANEFNVLNQAFEGRQILAVASTHKGEDEIFIEAYKQLKKYNEDLLMVLFPRHPHRGDDIARLISAEGLKYTQRSKTKGLEQSSSMDIYLADTIGEVGLWYALADAVIVAGCFEWKGQSPLEILKSGKPAYTGPNTQNFREMTDILISKNVLFKYENKEDLINAVNTGLKDKEFLEGFEAKSKAAIDELTGASDFIIKQVRNKLKQES